MTDSLDRRQWLSAAAAAGLGLSLPARAQERRFTPAPGTWREFEVTTRVEVQKPKGATRVWVPLPSVDTGYQKSLGDAWSTNAKLARVETDQRYGARMLVAEFADGAEPPLVEVTSRIQTQSRAQDFAHKVAAREDADTLRYWTRPTELMPTDGIVLKTAQEVTQGARTDVEKVQRLYEWVIANTYREPKVRGCGVGDIKAMLETQNFGGKCGDINALFVGLSRSVGVPARDVYGIRIATSAFGYRELGANPASLKGAQHCRAEVFLREYGWVAMDPADVGKVMRLETPEWLKDASHPVVSPVRKALFGGWEGNWMAYNTAHDVALPGSSGPRLGFLMYPQAENGNGRYDPYDPDAFKYTIASREIKA